MTLPDQNTTCTDESIKQMCDFDFDATCTSPSSMLRRKSRSSRERSRLLAVVCSLCARRLLSIGFLLDTDRVFMSASHPATLLALGRLPPRSSSGRRLFQHDQAPERETERIVGNSTYSLFSFFLNFTHFTHKMQNTSHLLQN